MSARRELMHDIEGRHFGRCLDQVWGAGRRTLIERLEFKNMGSGYLTAVVVKMFEKPVPSMSSSKPWPDLAGVWVFVPLEDETNTWQGLDAALTAFEAKHAKPE